MTTKTSLPLVTLVISTIAATLAFSGCSDSPNDLQVLETRRDSIRVEISKLNAELTQLENEIAELTGEVDLVQVTAISLEPREFKHYFTVQGNVETDRNATIFAETQGVVKSILVNEGGRVSKGQTILTLDTELIQRNIDEVNTQYALAKDVFERQERLWKQNIGSEMQFLEAKNNKDRFENTLATLQKQVNMGSVKAPFDGVVDQIVPRIGEMANPAMPVARVISLENMYVTAQVSESYIAVVEPGMPAEAIVPGGDTIRTTVKRVGKFINPENRTFEITLDLDKNANVRPNMYTALRINDLTVDSAMVIRSSMIMQDTKNREFVFVLNPSENHTYTVEKQLIEVGSSYGDYTWVSSGLTPGSKIVDKGARRVIEAQSVKLFQEK